MYTVFMGALLHGSTGHLPPEIDHCIYEARHSQRLQFVVATDQVMLSTTHLHLYPVPSQLVTAQTQPSPVDPPMQRE